jgi:hypothetical protein
MGLLRGSLRKSLRGVAFSLGLFQLFLCDLCASAVKVVLDDYSHFDLRKR